MSGPLRIVGHGSTIVTRIEPIADPFPCVPGHILHPERTAAAFPFTHNPDHRITFKFAAAIESSEVRRGSLLRNTAPPLPVS